MNQQGNMRPRTLRQTKVNHLIFYLFLSKLYNLAEEMEMVSLPDQEDSDPVITKLEGEKFFYD